ncbi:MAG: peptidase M42 [Kiritimatiellae bacterium]|nr:peptidase M42 [Kiritimatiellia bacterium]
MKLNQIIALTEELVMARGPGGREDEVRKIVRREMGKLCDSVWEDEAENVVGLVSGSARCGGLNAPAIRVMAHMDENALLVKRIEADGILRVIPAGSMRPWLLGMGPVDIMGDQRVVPGVLTMGPAHTTEETPSMWRSKAEGENKAPDWTQVHVITRMDPDALAGAGVHPGTPVVVASSRRGLVDLGDCVAGYFMDDRVCLAIMLAAVSLLREEGKKPAGDVYLVATCLEEIAGAAAAFAGAKLPGSVVLAVDVGPVAAEYGTRIDGGPIVVYADKRTVYTRSIADRLVALGNELGLAPQTATFLSYASDASLAKSAGLVARAGLLCIPTEGTHAFEVVPKAGVESCSRLLAAYLEKPEEQKERGTGRGKRRNM